MPKGFDFFEDTHYEPDEIDSALYRHQVELNQRKRNLKKKRDVNNEVGVAPSLTQEILDRREKYANDFPLMHMEVFPESTGIRPFGEVQIESIKFGQDVFRKGGRLLKLEPRGYAKTTRITNEALFAVLSGMQNYVVIVCSNVSKAAEIVDSIKTELMTNDSLLELFPGPIACFRHLDNNPMKAKFQTYDGKNTYIKYEVGSIRFPTIAGEPSSGKFIEVRPLTNLKGLNHKVKSGPDAGKVFRPTLFLFDDPQTHEEAKSSTSVEAIVALIKRDALRGGSHSRRASAIMSITPVCHGDVAFHFEKVEHSWDIVRYKMVEQFPEQHQRWLSEYAQIYLNYDRTIRGDRVRAALEARKFVEDNYEELHKGANVTWQWAFGWDEDPQTEISPLQHAYNIILDDGWVDFEYECQCNTEYGLYDMDDKIHADVQTITSSIGPLPRKRVPQEAKTVVTHIDVNKDVLTYMTVASGDKFQPFIIDFGSHPKQTNTLSKKNLAFPLRNAYPGVDDYREVLYLGVKDLLQTLAHTPYIREDGVQVFNKVLGIDIKYEEDFILRACRDANLPSMVLPTWGLYVGPDDDLLHNKKYPDGTRTYHNCVEKPNTARTVDYLNYDVNYFKTEVHKAWNKETGLRGSLSLFQQEWLDQFKVIGDHCNAEVPMKEVGKKTTRTRVIWKEKGGAHQVDNEYFDNLSGCFALLVREGIDIQASTKTPSRKDEESFDIKAWMDNQKGKKL